MDLLPQSPADVHGLELVEASKHTGTSNSSQDVGSGSLHHGHEALVLQDLDSAVNGALVLDTAARGHHHAPPDGVNGVGHEASSDGDSPAQQEGEGHVGSVSQEEGLESVKQTEVHATVDEDTDSGDGESSVQSLDTVRLESLHIDIDEAVELPLAALALGVIGQPGSGVVQRVDEHQRESPSESSAGDVGAELQRLGSVLRGLEDGFDLIFEGKVQGLGGEVPQNVSKVSSPEGVDSLSLEDPHGTVNHAIVGLVKTSLLDHLILVLDEELDSLDGSSSSLGDSSSNTSEHEILNESQLLLVTHYEA